MDTLKVMFQNGWTTLSGFVAGCIFYLATSGATIPTNKEELKNLLVAMALFAMGFTGKSATVGSRPSQSAPNSQGKGAAQ